MKTKVLLILMIVSCFSSPLMATIQFKDGETHNINYTINDDVLVDYQAPGMQTTLNLVNGGNIPNRVQIYQDSRVYISGGSVDRLDANNSSQVTVSGGSVWGNVYANQNGQVSIFGGSVGNYLLAYDNSQITIYGSNFAVDESLVGFGKITSISGGDGWNEPWRRLTGTLAGGNIINNQFLIGGNASINLVYVAPVPEPSSLLTLLLLSGMPLLRRKR